MNEYPRASFLVLTVSANMLLRFMLRVGGGGGEDFIDWHVNK